jgi:hypothetical protein
LADKRDKLNLVSYTDGMIEKICLACGDKFNIFPSWEGKVVCCSRNCRTQYSYQLAAKEVRQMSEPEIAWLAGLFDGEGSIVQTQRTRTPEGSIRIQVTNNVIAILEQIQEFTGVGRINVQSRKENNPRHGETYTWSAGTGYALEILRQIRPWLIVKAERADAVLGGRSFDRQSRWDDIYPEGQVIV